MKRDDGDGVEEEEEGEEEEAGEEEEEEKLGRDAGKMEIIYSMAMVGGGIRSNYMYGACTVGSIRRW